MNELHLLGSAADLLPFQSLRVRGLPRKLEGFPCFPKHLKRLTYPLWFGPCFVPPRSLETYGSLNIHTVPPRQTPAAFALDQAERGPCILWVGTMQFVIPDSRPLWLQSGIPADICRRPCRGTTVRQEMHVDDPTQHRNIQYVTTDCQSW